MSALPGRYNLAIYRGDTFLIVIDLGFDVTGLTFLSQVRARRTSEVLATASITVTDAAAGILEFVLLPAQTSALPNQAVWDLQSTASDGFVRTWLAGDCSAEGDVTRV